MMINEAPSLQQEKKPGFFKEVLGQFATTGFWKRVAEVMVQEAIAAFFMALGSTLFTFGKEKRNKEVAAPDNGGSQFSNIASRAFGAPQTPTYHGQEYRPAVPIVRESGNPSFPGFGKPSL